MKEKAMSATNANNDNQLMAAVDSYSIMPRNIEAQINDAINMRNALNRLFENLLELGKDFDRIPGTDKPTLLKPGAELLCKVFKLAQGKAEILDKSEDWENGIFSYTMGMPLMHIESGLQVAYGTGAANSMEKKHRYRKIKSEGGQDIQIPNPDPADLQNTLIKMANKRAYVDAVLKATCASRMFTQDTEDFQAMTGQFEKASTKQRDLIKKLFGSMPPPDALAEISGICGREVASYEDIHRTEASRIIDAKKGQGGGQGGNGGGQYGGYTGNGYNNNNGNYSKRQAATANDAQAGGAGGAGAYNKTGAQEKTGAAAGPENAPTLSGGDSDGLLECSSCGTAITKAEYGYSNGKYGRPLCRKCQTSATREG